MRILFIHQYFCPPGGSGNNRSFELGKFWIEAGIEPVFITSDAYFPIDQKAAGDRFEEREIEGLKVFVSGIAYDHMMPFRARIKAFLRFFRGAKRFCRQKFRKGDFDLIYASSTPPSVGELGRFLSRKWGIPFVFETVDVWPDVPIGMGILRNQWLARWMHKRVNRIYRDAVAVVSLSDGMREQVLSHGVDPDKVKVFYNGTNPEVFQTEARPEKDVFHLIYTGTVGIANGLHHLMEAMRLIQQELDIPGFSPEQIHLTVLGGGNDLQRVKEVASEKQVKFVRFLKKIPKEEVPELLLSADAGVVCFDNFSVLEANSANKFYDYLAAGLPVVLNYQGWQARYLDAYQCGISSDQGDDMAFAKAIVQMATISHEKRREMGQNARELAIKTFDRREIANSLAEFLRSLTAG